MIRPATPEDAEALTDAHLDIWDEAYTGLLPQDYLDSRRADRERRIEIWRDWDVGAAGQTTLVAEDPDDRGRLLGFVCAGDPRDEDPPAPFELWALNIRREAYGTGLGHEMLLAAIGSSAAYLWVLDGNVRATRFYEKHGFTLDGATKEAFDRLELRMTRPARH